MRGNRAAKIQDIFAQTARLQDGAAELQQGAAAVVHVIDTAAIDRGVAADSAVVYRHGGAAAAGRIIDDCAAAVLCTVAADSAVVYRYSGATPLSATTGDGASPVGRVAAQGAAR